MKNTFSWVISQLDTKPQEGELQDVVTTVHYRRVATDGTFYVDSYGAMGCPSPSETDFTAYDDLTQADVEAWLEASLDVEEMDAELITKLDNLQNPPIIVLPLPWADSSKETIQ
jgi:hypothetical protein